VIQRPIRRIAIFAPHFAEYSFRLARALARRADVLLFLDNMNQQREIDADLFAAKPETLRVVAFDSVGRSNRIKSLTRITAELLRFRPDVLLVQEQIDALTAWVCRVNGRLYPMLLTVHDPSPHSGADTQYVIDNAKNRAAIRNVARAYHVHGAFCRDQLLREMGAGKPVVETNHAVILTPPTDAAATPQEPGRILMFGRMEAYKGLGILLDAVDMLARRGVAFKLVIAGRGPELDRLASRVEGRRDIEVLNTFLTPAEASTEFQRADVVVTPYLNATQSGVVAAAFGNGRPVVASRAGGLADSVADSVNGVLVPAGDATELAAALEHVLTDRPYREDLAAGARAAAATTHDWRNVAESLLKFAQVTIC
jgi:glycosyltransferase involved in cell wall biosynthesis